MNNFSAKKTVLLLGNNRYGYSLTPSSHRMNCVMSGCWTQLPYSTPAFNSVLLSFWTPLQWIYFGEHLILSLAPFEMKCKRRGADGSSTSVHDGVASSCSRQKEVLRQRDLRITNLHYASSTCIGTHQRALGRSSTEVKFGFLKAAIKRHLPSKRFFFSAGKSSWFVVVLSLDKKEVIPTLAEKAIEQRYFIKGP